MSPPAGTEFTLVMLMACHREAVSAGDKGWIKAPDYALGDLRTLLCTGHVERHDGCWRPTIKAHEAARAGVMEKHLLKPAKPETPTPYPPSSDP